MYHRWELSKVGRRENYRSYCLYNPGGFVPINISHVKKYIRHNFKRIHSLEEIAGAIHISAETLRRTFRRKEGISLSTHLAETKINFIKQQLARTNKRCFEILYEAGFLREDSGARRFRQITGMTMEQYRKLYHNKKGV